MFWSIEELIIRPIKIRQSNEGSLKNQVAFEEGLEEYMLSAYSMFVCIFKRDL